jgi:nucleoside-diphosphate-sugar epimerase
VSERVVFLTGATGFIGSRLAERLVARGARLRCLVRSVKNASALRALGAEIIEGDTIDRAALRHGMRGCDLAFHLAAIYELGVVDARQLEQTNVDGTRAFLDAAIAVRIPKAVYVSTTVALGPSSDGQSESIVEYSGPYPSAYHETKARAHGLAREAQAQGLPLVIVCPAFVYGPGTGGPVGRFIEDLLRGRVPGLLTDPAWFSFVHVNDIAEGLVRAGEIGQPGATYVLGGEPESFNSFARRVATLSDRRLPVLRFPPALAALTGRVLDSVTRATGRRFAITQEGVASSARARWLHSDARARRELGWSPRSLETGLPETVAWFIGRRGEGETGRR